jgi:helix-turn-helix protein
MAVVDASTARRMWQYLEQNHALIYFTPAKVAAFRDAGLKGGWMGYFASRAAAAGDPAGRPLFAAHASLEWPSEPHLQLWHAATLLREHRGDGHVAALQRECRGGSVEEWDAAVLGLRERGLVDDAGGFTHAGRALRDGIERGPTSSRWRRTAPSTRPGWPASKRRSMQSRGASQDDRP